MTTTTHMITTTRTVTTIDPGITLPVTSMT
jgi:hypothetical protein